MAAVWALPLSVPGSVGAISGTEHDSLGDEPTLGQCSIPTSAPGSLERTDHPAISKSRQVRVFYREMSCELQNIFKCLDSSSATFDLLMGYKWLPKIKTWPKTTKKAGRDKGKGFQAFSDGIQNPVHLQAPRFQRILVSGTLLQCGVPLRVPMS